MCLASSQRRAEPAATGEHQPRIVLTTQRWNLSAEELKQALDH
jgi:hypothetical protein